MPTIGGDLQMVTSFSVESALTSTAWRQEQRMVHEITRQGLMIAKMQGVHLVRASDTLVVLLQNWSRGEHGNACA
jgi:hypothetical protein